MEGTTVANKSSLTYILYILTFLLSAILASTSEVEETSGSGRPAWSIDRNREDHFSWNEKGVEVKIGSNLTLSCLVDALDLQYEVFRISLIQGDVLFPLTENGLVHSPFSSIQRYTARMEEDSGNGGARITIHVEDVQPEDAGTYICSKYLERENSANLNVTVLMPVSDLYITAMDPDGEEMRMDSESEVFLQEHDFYGVGCIASVEGSQNAPQVRVEIDGKDETESFQVIHQVDASILQSGLTLWNSHLRLALVSAAPNPDFNEKTMQCIASQPGFPDVETSTRLLVQFAPLIRCVPERLIARQGTSATLDCNIRANPGSRITWSSARGDLSNYPNVFFDETVISSDETRLTLSIRNIRPINFQRYTLTAANIIASSQSTFELVEDETVVMETQPEVERFLSEDDDVIIPETVDDVFRDGSDDVAVMDEDRMVEKRGFVPELSSASARESSTVLEVNGKSVKGEERTVAPVLSTSSDVEGAFEVVVEEVDVMLPHPTPPDVKSTFPDVKSTFPDVKNTFSDVKSTSTYVKSTLPDAKRTVTASTLDLKTSTTTESILNLPNPTTALPSERIHSHSGKSHSSPGRARSAHHKGTTIQPPKATSDALPAAEDAVPKKMNAAESSEDQEQPLPAAPGEVHYSHSRSSSSSSSKKDSGKSGKVSKSTSGTDAADAIAVTKYLLALLLLIHWF